MLTLHFLLVYVGEAARASRRHPYFIVSCTKLLQKSEMRKDIVIELSYKGFSCASDYS